MIDFKPQPCNLFGLDVDALVNPVNCRGVMGAGLAKEFKEKYPEAYKAYKERCAVGNLRLGSVEIVPSGVERPAYIVLFPTKDDWRENSLASSIDKGLLDMVEKCAAKGIKSVGVPALGCGLGNLSWRIVRSIMVRDLNNDKGIKFIVTEPMEKTSY